jgi:hypothetical protein
MENAETRYCEGSPGFLVHRPDLLALFLREHPEVFFTHGDFFRSDETMVTSVFLLA